jgi:hypothetical protein
MSVQPGVHPGYSLYVKHKYLATMYMLCTVLVYLSSCFKDVFDLKPNNLTAGS